MAASLGALLLVTFCSIGVLHFESGAEANITTAEDSVWWAFATLTTVGYGDRYPVTTEGRIIAVLLMGAGVGLFGTFSGLLAAWFLGPSAASSEEDLGKLREEVAKLRQALEASVPLQSRRGYAGKD